MTADKLKRQFTGMDYFPPDMEPGEFELLVAFDIWIHKNHANSRRVGCPGREKLEAIVRAKTKVEDMDTLRHVGLCAACLDEMRAMKQEFSKPPSQKT